MLHRLDFRWGPNTYRATLKGTATVVVAPAELPLRPLRDALCAALYGAEFFPGGARGGLRGAGLTFEVNGLRYRVEIDLTTGRRALLHLQGSRAEPVADSPGAVNQMTTALLNLPSALVFRSLTLSSVDFPTQAEPQIQDGIRRALLAHATEPTVLPAEVAAARQRVEAARRTGASSVGATPWRDPVAVGGTAAGLIALCVGWASDGGIRFAGLAGPPLFGLAAWRALGWVDDAERRSERLRVLDEAEAAFRARSRQLDELEGFMASLERLTGSRRPEAIEAALRDLGAKRPHSEVVDHVDVYAGGLPAANMVEAAVAAFGVDCVATASAGLVLAAMAARGPRPAPLFWVADGAGDTGITWPRVFDFADNAIPLVVFRRTAVGGVHAAALEPGPETGVET